MGARRDFLCPWAREKGARYVFCAAWAVEPCDYPICGGGVSAHPFEDDYGSRVNELLDAIGTRTTHALPGGQADTSALESAITLSHRRGLMWCGAFDLSLGILAVALLMCLVLWGRPFWMPKPKIQWWIFPAGEFRDGSDRGGRSAQNSEHPNAQFYLDSQESGKYEVTNAEYAQCVRVVALQGTC